MPLVKKVTEVIIYESPDGGKTVYSRVSGDPSGVRQLHSISPELQEHIEKVNREQQWMDILRASERSPALQDAIDRVIVIYELINKDDKGPDWHPV